MREKWRRRWDSDPRIEVLQTSPLTTWVRRLERLPEGGRRDRAGARGGCPSRIRTSVNGSKVRCPTTGRRGTGRAAGGMPSGPTGRLTRLMERKTGFEPATSTLARLRATNCATSARVSPDKPVWCREPESNWRHRDFQSRALPTELSRPNGLTRLAARRRAENTTARGYGGRNGPLPILAGRTQWARGVRTERGLAGQLAQAVDPVNQRRVGRE